MKQNKYDNQHFFKQYQQMSRSIKGLEGAGEWHALKEMIPSIENKHVLDLGCGYGWHCKYMIDQQASSVIGVDISEKMLTKAREINSHSNITYQNMPIEDISFEKNQFDLVFSSLAFHYLESFKAVCEKVYNCLKKGGFFVFSVEHPIFTSREKQDWYYDEHGNRMHWAVDAYQEEGVRNTSFLTANVIKYHRTLSTYMNNLIQTGFRIKVVKEPVPSEEILNNIPEMKDERRRPMFLLISAVK
ncbi:class I SAM-dependent methyltransferase [Sutcliffiella rhizosphaerae]|uniref:tRNA U34 carboxymethyltransferase n=1 Tax=Sutcliffiella rhizosphaerae TaxID=2880967 RepID=A0ABN8ADY3_9BACI|nr:class I SAM-dependent methyltransferase [Sutcliffiella rhizosphaerae]CAG9621308.1 tRNA U34 carboxymethyltransferase [Sutcliffiella rhizosphaerae]